MPMIFKLEIELGNDAMKTPGHVADKLQELSRRVRGAKLQDGEGAKVLDLNGTSVGRWRFILDDPGDDA
jgi:hypothetical protein